MNPLRIKILQHIDANGGRVAIASLNQVTENGARLLAPLCIGRIPNCVKDGEFVAITEKGVRTLRESGITPNTTVAPIVKRDQASPTTSIINIKIDRNAGVKVTCQLSPSFIEFLTHNGTSKNVVETKGASFARNWDCNAETKYVEVNLQELDQNFSGVTNIISDYGINTFILKLAGANNGTWEVTYKGLISKEKLVTYAQALRDRAKHFYYNYVKAVKIEISLNVVE